jgi:hypothetical protein
LLTVSDGEHETTDTLRVAVYPEDFDGLLAHYTFDDGTATNSSSIDGLHGKLVGDASVVFDPQRGPVLRLIKGGYVDCGSDARFDLVHELTFVCWIRIDDFGERRHQQLVSKWRSWGLSRYRSTNSVSFYCAGVYVSGYSWNNIPSEAPVADGNWHHVTGVFDRKEMRIYVDGRHNSSIRASGEMNVTVDPVRIGDHTADPSTSLDALIDDVRIYNRALGPDEVAELYSATK